MPGGRARPARGSRRLRGQPGDSSVYRQVWPGWRASTTTPVAKLATKPSSSYDAQMQSQTSQSTKGTSFELRPGQLRCWPWPNQTSQETCPRQPSGLSPAGTSSIVPGSRSQVAAMSIRLHLPRAAPGRLRAAAPRPGDRSRHHGRNPRSRPSRGRHRGPLLPFAAREPARPVRPGSPRRVARARPHAARADTSAYADLRVDAGLEGVTKTRQQRTCPRQLPAEHWLPRGDPGSCFVHPGYDDPRPAAGGVGYSACP